LSRKLELGRRSLPVTAESIYLGTGSWGPTSRIYATTLRRLTLEDLRSGRMSAERFEAMAGATERIRRALATLVGAAPETIALTQSTSAALEIVLDEFPWRTGDEVVCTQLEHRACTQPLSEVSRRHSVDVRLAHVPEEGARNLDWLARCVTPRTRLIAFTGVSYTTGQRLPLAAIAAFGREHNVATLVDAAQWVGAMPLDLPASGVDFCAFPLQKWLSGPEGMGALYVRDESFASFKRDRVSQSRGVLQATAEHLDWLAGKIGWDFIFERTQSLSARARAALAEIPAIRVITPSEHAGLVTIEASSSHAGIAARLERRRVVLRAWPEQGRYRLSTAWFNTDKEIATAVAAFR
jgi:L-cysteine/cystine lyase